MAKKRTLKRDIQNIVSDLFVDAVATSSKLSATHPEQVTALLNDILKLESDYLARVNNYERAHAKAYFKKICASFDAEVGTLIERINAQLD